MGSERARKPEDLEARSRNHAGYFFLTDRKLRKLNSVEKLSRLQVLRIAGLCGAATKSIERYQAGAPVRPATEFAIRSAIKHFRFRDPRPAPDPTEVKS